MTLSTEMVKPVIMKIIGQGLVAILLFCAVLFLNNQNANLIKETQRMNTAIQVEQSKRIDDLTSNVNDCNKQYNDLLKMYYFSHDKVSVNAIPENK